MKRLKALEEENSRLRKVANRKEEKPLIVTESEYKGHPTLVFEGSFKSFSLGIKKLSILKNAWPHVETFLQKHSNSVAEQVSYDFDDGKI